MPNRTVDIKPGVSVLAVLRHLNYKPWYALAEFVDNSIQSFITHSSALNRIHQGDYTLRVEIDIDTTVPTQIIIRDNAAGISEDEYGRAFRPAAVPPDCTGLAEFGMGMKSAACWFAPKWIVRTSALGEPVVRTVQFDIENIVNDQIEELLIEEHVERSDSHYTEIILQDVFHMPTGRTKGKLKDHLTDIYRNFIRNKTLDLFLQGSPLNYIEPKILKAAYFKTRGNQKLNGARRFRSILETVFQFRGLLRSWRPAAQRRQGFRCFEEDVSSKGPETMDIGQIIFLVDPIDLVTRDSLENFTSMDSM